MAERELPGELRWPALLALVLAGALDASLPDRLIVGPRALIPALEAAMLLPLVLGNPTRFTRVDRRLRYLSIGLILLLAAVNATALGFVVRDLLDKEVRGAEILVGALQIWLTNVLAFALLYWEMDRDGPVVRSTYPREALGPGDFRFTQDDLVQEGDPDTDWRPTFVDYLYLSVTNSTAFSPTDTLPLTARAKMLMSFQGLLAFLLSILVISRGVNILN